MTLQCDEVQKEPSVEVQNKTFVEVWDELSVEVRKEGCVDVKKESTFLVQEDKVMEVRLLHMQQSGMGEDERHSFLGGTSLLFPSKDMDVLLELRPNATMYVVEGPLLDSTLSTLKVRC